ncbi:DUF2255 family protein [Streptomyces sp. SID6041]|nr:DUF2255 family protein [Streptomyces sp. SID6041]
MNGDVDGTAIVLWVRDGNGRWSGRTVWTVVVDGEAYIRSAFGRRSAWYRRVLRQTGAHADAYAEAEVEPEAAAGQRRRVLLRPAADPVLVARVSDAYRAAYGLHWPGPVASMNADEAAATTLRLADPGEVAQLPA